MYKSCIWYFTDAVEKVHCFPQEKLLACYPQNIHLFRLLYTSRYKQG